jgi:hypothetical protein
MPMRFHRQWFPFSSAHRQGLFQQARQGNRLNDRSSGSAHMESPMALLEDAFKNGSGSSVAAGLGVGVGLAIAGPLLLPLVRGLAKTVIRAGLVAYDQGRVMIDEMTADGGLISEARQELTESRHTAAERRATPIGEPATVSKP